MKRTRKPLHARSRRPYNLKPEESSPWMVGFMNGFQSLTRHMRVYLRRGDIHMTEHRLNGAQICTACEQVSRKGMSQCMGRYPLLKSCGHGISLQQLPETLTRKFSAGAIHEHVGAHPSLDQGFSTFP